MRSWRLLFPVTLIVFSLCCVGCGDGVESIANLVPVSGTVSFEDKPLPHGTVLFDPVEKPGESAVGKIVDGKFTMVTTVSAPGVVVGKYRVRIISTEESAVPPNAAPPFPEPKSLIPKKYNDLKTSGLEIEVVEGMAEPEWDLEP